MAFKIGNKYFTASEQGGDLQSTTEQDLLGRLGTGGSLEASRKAGDLIDVDPSQIRFQKRTEVDKYALANQGEPGYDIFGPTGHLGIVRNLAQAQALGLTAPTQLPQGQLEQNQVFNQYLQQTGQTFNSQTQQFSGSASVPNPNVTREQAIQEPQNAPQTQANQAPGSLQTNAVIAPTGQAGAIQDATVGVGGQAPVQVGGRFGTQQFGRIGNDVVEIMSDGSQRRVTEAEFNQKLKAQGLNLEALPQISLTKSYVDQPPSGPPTPSPTEPADDVAKKVAEYQSIFKVLGITDIKNAFEATKKEYQALQDKKNAEILEINDNPWVSEGLRQKQVQKVGDKYELKENTLSNQQKLYESLYEEGLAQAKFVATGIWDDRNKLLDLAQKREESLSKLITPDYDLREVDGSLYRVDKKTGKSELLIRGTPTRGDGKGGIYDQFDFRTANAILSEANKFETSDIVKRYNAVIDATNVVNSFNPNTKNPADHQALVYTFAKALDPDSVVREGEYATIKRYAQGLLDRYKGEINQAINGTGFLSSKAIADIQSTINNLQKSRSSQYQNAYNSTARTIDNISGKTGSSGLVLTNFEGGLSNPPNHIESLRSQLKFGEILVKDKKSGTIGAVPVIEFNQSKYDAL